MKHKGIAAVEVVVVVLFLGLIVSLLVPLFGSYPPSPTYDITVRHPDGTATTYRGVTYITSSHSPTVTVCVKGGGTVEVMGDVLIEPHKPAEAPSPADARGE